MLLYSVLNKWPYPYHMGLSIYNCRMLVYDAVISLRDKLIAF